MIKKENNVSKMMLMIKFWKKHLYYDDDILR